MLGHVLALARLLRADQVLANAIRDLADDALARDAKTLATIEAGLLGKADFAFRYLAKLYHQTPDVGWQRTVDQRPDRIGRTSSQETLPTLLRRVHYVGGGEEHAPGHNIRDLADFADVATALANEPAGQIGGVHAQLRQLVAIGESCRRLREFKVLCTTGSLTTIASRLDALLTKWDKLLATGPRVDSFEPDVWVVPDTNGLEHDAATLASRIELYLNGRRSQRLVLFRAKVYFEHFFYDEARDVIKIEEQRVVEAEEDGKKAKAQRELKLRRHLDRFIFQEGFFPITEASARRGNLDLLLDNAEQAGIRPLVAEVKQAVSVSPDNVGHADVQQAIQAARAEIPQYVGHLRARIAWQNIEPLVVVFHSSVEDVTDLETEDVILIDIGTRSPSRVRPVEKSTAKVEA